MGGSLSCLVGLQLCNVGAWTVMASAATRMGILEVAAHQLMLSLWLVIAFVQGGAGCHPGSRFRLASRLVVPFDGQRVERV